MLGKKYIIFEFLNDPLLIIDLTKINLFLSDWIGLVKFWYIKNNEPTQIEIKDYNWFR